ncbi:MAG TPA: sugar phosphate isomerase/epimerase [Terriglobia bacterium]|nr:sugar phosphate isomerase/epimerase [Terriglobia bacterium]
MEISCCWLYAITKYGYPPSIADTFKVLGEMKSLGFDCVELEGVRRENLMAVYEKRRELKQYCDDRGLKVINFCPVLPGSVSLDRREREESWDLFKRGLEIAKFFDAVTIQGDSFTPPLKFRGDSPYKESISYGKHFSVEIDPKFDWGRQWDAMVESFSFMARESKKAGLRFCIEPRVGELLSNTDAILRMMDAVGDENLGAVFDTAHQNAQKEILALSVEKLGKRIFYVHAADNDGRANDHVAAGRGTVDWDGIFEGLRKHGFSGYVAVDVGMVNDIDAQYRESLQFLKAKAAQHGL